MTYEEVIKELQILKGDMYDSHICKALKMGIEALEKQIPKKPKETTTMLMCPTCNKPYSSKHYAHEGYCKHCGQHISDWSEVE